MDTEEETDTGDIAEIHRPIKIDRDQQVTLTAAESRDPTAEVDAKAPDDHSHGRADLQQENMFIEMIIEGASAIDETIPE